MAGHELVKAAMVTDKHLEVILQRLVGTAGMTQKPRSCNSFFFINEVSTDTNSGVLGFWGFGV